MESAQTEASETLAPFFEKGEVKTSIDPATNSLVVSTPESLDTLSELAIRQGAKGAAVGVEFRHAPPDQFEHVLAACNVAYRWCDLPMRGGTTIYGETCEQEGRLWNEICTSAFRANGYDGHKYILTAGHCVKRNSNPNGQTFWNWTTADASQVQHPIGTVTQWHFPGKDWAKLDATGRWPDTPPWEGFLAYWGSTNEYPVIGQAQPYKGQTLCHIGSNTGASCGIVTAAYVNTSYGGNQMNNVFEAEGKGLALGGGDSGGPVIASNIALGITSGGYFANSGAILDFHAIPEATQDLGVNLFGPGAPEALIGGPSNVQAGQATLSAMVNPHGLTTNFVFQYGQSGFNHQTPWYGAGSAQGFRAVSATISGLDPLMTYNYRLVAVNGQNTAYTAEGQFVTAAPPIESKFFLRNTNTTGIADQQFVFGGAETIPVMGDWNGDGVDTPGLYKPSNGEWFLRNSNNGGVADIEFKFGGTEGTVPLAGDWNGDGTDTIGIFHAEESASDKWFLRNSNTQGVADIAFTYGSGLAMRSVVGDWNGDGVDTPGLYKSNAEWFLRNSNTSGVANLEFLFGGGVWSRPVAGDFNNDGVDTIGMRN